MAKYSTERDSVELAAQRCADAMEALGSMSAGTWQERREALIAAIKADGGSGAGEVLGWFEADTSAIG